MDILITNNPLLEASFAQNYKVEYVDISPIEILRRVRDFVHLGHGLITHPMAGGLPPGLSPYKSVVVTCVSGDLNMDNIGIIESALDSYSRGYVDPSKYSKKHLEDFARLDMALLKRH